MDHAFETALCNAMMGAWGSGAENLDDVAQVLNRDGVASADGSPWSGESLRGTMRAAAPPAEFDPIDPVIHPRHDPARAALYKKPPRHDLAPPTVEERTRRLLATGLRNLWYVIASSHEVGPQPTGLRRLGEGIVVWRDADGEVHALEDRCPHRGVKMSIGDLRDGLLTCAYHGVQVDEYGRVAHVPALPGCPLEGRTTLKRFPTIESSGAVFAYFGDDAHLEPPPLEIPTELADGEWSGIMYTDVWNANYRYIYDNLVDPMHTPYLHGETYTLQYGRKDDRIGIRETDHGFETFREGQSGVNADCLEWLDTGSSFCSRVEIPLPPSVGPGGPMHIIFYATPVDEHRTGVNILRLRRVSGWQRDWWSFVFKYRMDRLTNDVVNQDKRALEAMPPWPAEEGLYQHDAGVTKLRRMTERRAKAQAEELLLQLA